MGFCGFLWESGVGLAPLLHSWQLLEQEGIPGSKELRNSKIPCEPWIQDVEPADKTRLIPGRRSGITGTGAVGMGWQHPLGAFPCKILSLQDPCRSFMGSALPAFPRNGFGSSPCCGFPGETLWEFIPLGKTWMQHGNKSRNCCWGDGWS